METEKGGGGMNDEDNWTVKDVFDGMSEEEKIVVYYMVGKALEDNDTGNAGKEVVV